MIVVGDKVRGDLDKPSYPDNYRDWDILQEHFNKNKYQFRFDNQFPITDIVWTLIDWVELQHGK